MHQRARDPRRRTREHRHDRALTNFRDAHHAAVRTHNHQRRGDASLLHTCPRHLRRPDHLRQNRAVQDSRPRKLS